MSTKILCGSTDDVEEVKAQEAPSSPRDKYFAAYPARMAKGGKKLDDSDPQKVAVLMIEFQNEFAHPEGKLHKGVKKIMDANGMLKKSVDVCAHARSLGMKVMHSPIMFKNDSSDNPNPGQGILGACSENKFFLEDTWNTAFVDEMKPKEGDIVIKNKRGLDAFPGTDLEEQLKKNGIETLVLGGFLTNCCVESTMRTAFEKGFNVVTLTDCTATNNDDAQRVATEVNYGMFSAPMTAEKFKAIKFKTA